MYVRVNWAENTYLHELAVCNNDSNMVFVKEKNGFRFIFFFLFQLQRESTANVLWRIWAGLDGDIENVF